MMEIGQADNFLIKLPPKVFVFIFMLKYKHMNIRLDKSLVLFLLLTGIWYLIIFFVPYNSLADSLGQVNLGHGHSWPLSFFLTDALTLSLTIGFIMLVIQGLKKKTLKLYWVLFAVLLIYPLVGVWATLQDLIFNPIAP